MGFSFQDGLDGNGISEQLLVLRTPCDETTSDKAAANFWRPKQNYYDQGEKPGRPTAWRIKQQQTERTITAIEDANRNSTVDPLVLKSFMIAINEDSQGEFLTNFQKFQRKLGILYN